MSLKLTVWAWEQDVGAWEKVTLLAFAEFAPDFREPIELSVSRMQLLMSMTGLDAEDIPRVISSLKDSGHLRMFGETENACLFVLEDPNDDAASAQLDCELAKPSALPKRGYVYLLEGDGYFKIGRSMNPQKRSQQLDIQLPYEVNLLHVIESTDYVRAEIHLHKLYAHRRLNGEWFRLSPKEVEQIKAIPSLYMGVKV